jgi:hypothetical protein
MATGGLKVQSFVMNLLILVGILLGIAVGGLLLFLLIIGVCDLIASALVRLCCTKPKEPQPQRFDHTVLERDPQTDTLGSTPLEIPYRPITPPYVDEPRLRRTHDAHRYHRPPPPGMWDRRG